MRQKRRSQLKNQAGMVAGILAASMALSVYWLTLAPDINWAHYGVDGGDLITAVLTRGNPHPSGYPTYLLLGYLVEFIPLWPIAHRFNLFSAMTMAGAVGILTLTTPHTANTTSKNNHIQRLLPAAALSLTFAFSYLVWGQAIITEVYGLYLLFCAFLLWALLQKKAAWLTGSLLGLTITAHPTGIFFLPLALYKTKRRQWPTLFFGMLIGLLPFALLPFLSSGDSPVAWGDLRTVSGWWWLVSSQIYRGYAFSFPPAEWSSRAAEWGQIMGSQFTWAGLPLIILGFVFVKPSRRQTNLWLLLTAVSFFIFAFFYQTNDAIIFTLPAWLLLSLLLYPAYEKLGWLAFALPLTLILINFDTNHLKHDHLIRNHTESLLADIPDKAIVETPGDPTIFTLWYFVYGEEQRTDLIPVDRDLFAFTWYRDRLQHLHPNLQGLEEDNIQRFRQLNHLNHPYCWASLAQEDLDKHRTYSLSCQ